MGALILGWVAIAWAQAPPPDGEKLHARAVVLEREGNNKEAVQTYVLAARYGSALAARRLSVAYANGHLSLERDMAESQKWDRAANLLRERTEGGWGCPPKCPK